MGKPKSTTVTRIVVFLLSSIILLSCGAYALSKWCFDTTVAQEFVSESTDPAFVQANAEIELPPSTTDIHSRYDGFQEFFMQVRFSMKAEDLPVFLKSTLCTGPLTPEPTGSHQQRNLLPEWWNSSDAKVLQGCGGYREDFGQGISVDMTDPNTYIVYVTAGSR